MGARTSSKLPSVAPMNKEIVCSQTVAAPQLSWTSC